MQKICLVLFLAAFMTSGARAQEVQRILYLAAHPDDENTRLIAHWSRAEGREVAYLSLTRGEGGQNLIGPELGPALGALREAELREARKIDGAKQFFTSAPDFGYSKSAEEAFEVWDREALLGELFRIAAEFRPDVIVTRFPPDSRAGHGHHTASALLAMDLFARLQRDRMCNGDWAPKALYWNASSWWINESEARPKSDSLVNLNVGGYHEGLQKSVLQIGTEARSMHKSQGFGSENDHGFRSEILQLLAGTPVDWTAPPAANRAYQPWREVRASRPWFTDRDSLPLVRTEIVVNESPNPLVWDGKSLAKGERLEREASELEPAEYVSGDRVKGELRRPLLQADPLSVSVSPSGLIATKTARYTLKVAITRWALAKDFEVEIRIPKGWILHSPKRLKWTALPESEPTALFEVVIEASPNSVDGFLEFWSGGKAVRSVVKLRYDHIPQSEVWVDGSVPLRFVPMKLPDAEVGVIEGAGDDAAMALEQLGFRVKRLDPLQMAASDLDGLIAVVTGVRAYNSTLGMDRANALLEPWISKGGRLVMQYATASKDRTADQMGPIPFELGRKRVTVEGTLPRILKPEHPLWNSPNALSISDFDGWVQERGLYFAERWPAEFIPIISWSDPGEPPAEGALITAQYGQGSVTYCALSLFRQWREGVPGAYRILANLVAHDH